MKFVLLITFLSVAVAAIGVIAGTKTDVERARTGSALHLSDTSSLTGNFADSAMRPVPLYFGPP